jgi:hypothetical protein
MIGKRSELRVLNTTPLQPASNDRATISALLETGEEESRNGFLNFNPQKSTDKSMLLDTTLPPYMKDSQVQCLGFRGSRFWVQSSESLVFNPER